MQSEDDFSLSGIALTALHFDGTSRVLISGDQSGTVTSTRHRFFFFFKWNGFFFYLTFSSIRVLQVRIFKFKSEPYTAENSFISFQGIVKNINRQRILSWIRSCWIYVCDRSSFSSFISNEIIFWFELETQVSMRCSLTIYKKCSSDVLSNFTSQFHT